MAVECSWQVQMPSNAESKGTMVNGVMTSATAIVVEFCLPMATTILEVFAATSFMESDVNFALLTADVLLASTPTVFDVATGSSC